MNRAWRCIAASTLLGFSGCSADLWTIRPLITNAIETECQNAAASTIVPDSIPADLTVVQADPARFDPTLHPLANVVVGTVLDDLSGLDSCWGHYTRWVGEAGTGDEGTVSEQFAVLQFDLQAGRVTLRQYFTIPPNDAGMANINQLLGTAFFPDLPIFSTEVYAITSMTDNLLMLQGVSAEGAAVGQDGRPVFSCLMALASETNAKATRRMLVTRQGDFLKEDLETVEPGSTASAEDPVPAEVDDLAKLWVRFECSAQ